MLYLGIDGGGTKTDLCLFDSEKGLVARSSQPSLDYHRIGIDNLGHRIRNDFTQLLNGACISEESVQAITVGVPCYGEDEAITKELERQVRYAFSRHEKVFVVNDVVCAMYGSLGGRAGICILSGTGSVAMGINELKHIERVGGWSRHFSDIGSTYWLGVQAMTLFSQQAEGVVRKGALFDFVMDAFDLKQPMDFISIGDRMFDKREKVAEIQLLLMRAAGAGDESACLLYKIAAELLAMQALAVKDKLWPSEKASVRTTYAGGLFNVGALVLDPLEWYLQEYGMSLVKPEMSPVAGALYFAIENGQEEIDETIVMMLRQL